MNICSGCGLPRGSIYKTEDRTYVIRCTCGRTGPEASGPSAALYRWDKANPMTSDARRFMTKQYAWGLSMLAGALAVAGVIIWLFTP